MTSCDVCEWLDALRAPLRTAVDTFVGNTRSSGAKYEKFLDESVDLVIDFLSISRNIPSEALSAPDEDIYAVQVFVLVVLAGACGYVVWKDGPPLDDGKSRWSLIELSSQDGLLADGPMAELLVQDAIQYIVELEVRKRTSRQPSAQVAPCGCS